MKNGRRSSISAGPSLHLAPVARTFEAKNSTWLLINKEFSVTKCRVHDDFIIKKHDILNTYIFLHIPFYSRIDYMKTINHVALTGDICEIIHSIKTEPKDQDGGALYISTISRYNKNYVQIFLVPYRAKKRSIYVNKKRG